MRVSVRGAELDVVTSGHGPACFVLCSIGTKPNERQFPPPLRDRMTLVFISLRGSGQSTGNAADLTFDVLAEDLEAVRQNLGYASVAVLGPSILGVLALEYSRRSKHVSHVITVGTPPIGDMADVTARAGEFFHTEASDERKRAVQENLAKLPADPTPAQYVFAQTPMRFFDPHADATVLFADADVRPEFLMHLMGALTSRWDVRQGIDELRAPILLTHGRHDYTVPYTLWNGIVEKLPDATLHLFERSGHQPYFEEPMEFTAVVERWLAVKGFPLAD